MRERELQEQQRSNSSIPYASGPVPQTILEKPTRRKLPRKARISISLASVAALLVGLYLGGVFTKKEAKAVMAAGAKTPTPVQVEVVTTSPIENRIYTTGSVLANEEVELKSEIAGRITAINFAEGSQVSRGALLVKINDADLRATLKKLQSQEELATKEEQRAKGLVAQNLLSEEQYDALLNKLQIVQADIEKIRTDIEKTEIRAPFNGVVGLRAISVGSTVTTSTSIARVQQLDPIKLEFSIPEKYGGLIQNGRPISFTIVGTEQTFTGSVYAIEPRIDLATRTLRVRALSANPTRSLVPGAFAKVMLSLSTIPNAIAIPTTAIIPEISGQKVYVMENGKAISRRVTAGVRTESLVQILSGLSVGDSLITTGVMQIRDGSAVSKQ